MKSFLKFYTEAKQVGILYHYTLLGRAYEILTKNKLGYGPNICFTRDKRFHYHHRGGIATDECRFVIDGDKLSEHYKIKPYDYFHKEKHIEHQGPHDEQEERIINGPVKDLDLYLMKIQIFKSFLNYLLKYPNDNFYNSFNRKYYTVKKPEDVIKLFEAACDCPVELI